ncbi:MAG: hypothetical protein HY246_11630 [Proteobacteria bacterium]|nr:hypothetical protein [Pseudomonadota bacterium]
MKYLWNLPLTGAALAGWGFVYLSLLSQPRSGDETVGMAFAIIYSGATCAVLLGAALTGCVATGGFDWLSAGRIGSLAIVLTVYVPLVSLLLLPVGTAVDAHFGRIEPGTHASLLVVWLSRFASVGLPLALLGYAAWLINAPAELRDVLAVRYAAIGAVAALGILAAVATYAEGRKEVAKMVAKTTAEQQEIAERDAKQRAGFAALTDADPLTKWLRYADSIDPPDVSVEALRRLAARPTLEADLVAALTSRILEMIYAAWWMVAHVATAPAAALEPPLRQSIAAVADMLARTAATEISELKRKEYVYYNFTDHLRVLPDVMLHMATTTGIDLRDAVAPLRQIIATAYPSSGAADFFVKALAGTAPQIDAALAARTKKP